MLTPIPKQYSEKSEMVAKIITDCSDEIRTIIESRLIYEPIDSSRTEWMFCNGKLPC